jgi:hypothetical protein
MGKKLHYFLAASLLILTSCSKNNAEQGDGNIKLPKSKYYKYIDFPSDNYESTYRYNGNKIESILDDNGSKTVFTYTGDLITKKEDFSNKKLLVYCTLYEYENNKLKEAVHIFNNQKFLKKYTYNKDKTVSYSVHLYNDKLNTTTEIATGTFTLENGNIIKQVDKESKDYGSADIVAFKYDTNNSPLKNVIGIGLLLDVDYSINNIIETTHTTSLQDLAMHITSFRNSITPYKSTNTATYTYDSEGYVLTKAFYNDGKLGYRLSYTY